jgi:hypothetical protein
MWRAWGNPENLRKSRNMKAIAPSQANPGGCKVRQSGIDSCLALSKIPANRAQMMINQREMGWTLG